MNPEPPPPPPSLTPPPLPAPQAPPPLPRPKRSPWGFIVGIVLLVAFSIFALIAFQIFGVVSRIREAQKPRPFLVEAPKYETLLGEDFAGSGFHFTHGGTVYLCATKHQFDGATPKVMASIDFDEPIKVTGVAHEQEDVQVLTFDSAKLSAVPPLPYDLAAKVNGGLPVYIYSDEGVEKGHVTFAGKTNDRIRIRMEKPFAAMGASGSPIVSGETGTVIGVLTEASDPEKATRVVAERLVMP